MNQVKIMLLFAGIILLGNCTGVEQNKDTKTIVTDLATGFQEPPAEARPRTWMHAMSGNMTKAGITKDLESMAKVGIGGLLLFNITQGIPNGPIIYNSSEHHEMLQHAAKEAERLGLSFGVHNCDGWSSSGGPWVTPEESMKMVVWSETLLSGGTKQTIKLPQASAREGFYQDIALLAYPSLATELDDLNNPPVLKASSQDLDIHIISDGKIDDESLLPKDGPKNPWIDFTYQTPKTIRSAKIIFNDRNATALLQTSEDGQNYTTVRDLLKVRTGKGEWAINDHFEGITSKYFRLQFNQKITIKEAELTANYYIQNPLGRTAIARTEDVDLGDIGAPAPEQIISKDQILDLTSSMDKNGVLNTDLPAGDWTILRFGYTSTGAFNNPASDEGRGLEVDKLSRPAFKKHYDAFIKKVVENAGPLAPNALQYVEIDSYEMGGQNWTDEMAQKFKATNGYDFLPFLPLIAGRFVADAETSDIVLSDYRKLIGDLMTENYFGYFTELCHEDGLKSYIEPYGFGPLNDLDVGAKADIPMGEFWMNRPITQVASAVSSAHIYGKKVISAESFTSNPTINWKGHPAMAKNSGDLAWTLGINEFMFHRFAHQANTHVAPGMTMNRWGFHFDRTQTWWENAGADWFKYIARGSYLLRQGNPVSDLLIYIGEGAPNSTFKRTDFKPAIPNTINFDNVNTDVLLNRVQAQNGKMVLPEGTSYAVLVLKNVEKISLETLKKIHALAKAGIPVYGEKPKMLAGLIHTDEAKEAFENIAQELDQLISTDWDWPEVLAKSNLSPDLKIKGRADMSYAHRATSQEDIYFFFNPDSIAQTFEVDFRMENKIPERWNPMDGSIQKLAQFASENQVTKASISLKANESVFVVFRESAAAVPSIANQQSKVVQEQLDFYLNQDNGIVAEVSQNGSYEVQLAGGKTWPIKVQDIPQIMPITGPWELSFQPLDGKDEDYTFKTLLDWKGHPNEKIKYFSGTATYKKTFEIPDNFSQEDLKAQLDLGTVYIVAQVKLNGQDLGVSWMPPFEVDLSSALQTGINELEIQVTNQWSNHLIGDERFPANDGAYQLGPHRATDLTMPSWYVNNEPLPESKRTTFTTAPFYKAGDPLMPSGLLGPVQIRFSKQYQEVN